MRLSATERLLAFFWGPADARTYALVRIALALAGLVNLADLWPHRHEYLSATGMIPLETVREAGAGAYYGTVFTWASSEHAVTAVLVVAAIALVTLGLGVATRASAALVFVWHLSYCHRAFPVLHGWDHILRIYSFLVLVSPVGDAWRLTARRANANAPVPIYGLRLMQWQLFVLYTTTVWLKVPDPYWRSGQLLAYFAVSLFSRTPDSTFLVRHEWLSALATYASLAIEASLPWLLWFKRTRIVGLVAGFGLHLVIGATARIGVFSICMIVPYMAFLDGGDIDWLGGLVRARSRDELRRRFFARRPNAAGVDRDREP